MAGVLETAEDQDILLEERHAVAGAGGRGGILAAFTGLEACPFAAGGVEVPEVIVVVLYAVSS